MSRLDKFLDALRADLDDQKDLAAALTNGDAELPNWAHIAESTDHLKIWDEAEGSAQMGFVTVEY